MPGLREAVATSPAPVIAVSPIVGGAVVKGPTADFLRWAGRPVSAAGVVEHYAGLLDGLVCDEEGVEGVAVLRTDTLMPDAAARRRVAAETLAFAEAVAPVRHA